MLLGCELQCKGFRVRDSLRLYWDGVLGGEADLAVRGLEQTVRRHPRGRVHLKYTQQALSSWFVLP